MKNKINFWFLLAICLSISLATDVKDSAYNPCNQRVSSDSTDESKPTYVVECSVSDPATLKQLATSVKAIQIHGDGDDVSSLNPESVVEFYLSGSITSLSHNAFAWLPNLRRLVVDSHPSESNATGVLQTHETSFGGLPNLTALTLITKFSANSIVPKEVFPDALRAVGPALQHLAIHDADMNGELDRKDMKHFPNLKALSIVNSPRLKLSNEEKVFGDKLEKLELRSVSIPTLPKSITTLKGLKFLRLENVQLADLPSSSFSNMAATLTELHVDNNPLITLNPAVFQGMKALKILSVTKTEIKQLPEKIFNDLVKLDDLSLSGNRLESLPDGVFQNNGRLAKVDLSKNRLGNISRATLVGLEHCLFHLELSDNRIRSFRVANMSGQLGVSLASNDIRELTSDFFEPGAVFNRLILSSNPLSIMEVGAFSGVSIGSENLYIQRANFTWLDLAVFHGMKSNAGPEVQAQLFVSSCPNLVGVNVSRSNIQWPSGVKQVVFVNNPKFVLAEPTQDAYFPEVAKLVKRKGVQFIFDGYGLCNCRWNWLRSGKFAKKEERSAIVDFSFFDESSPATCCNIPGLGIEEFLDRGTFETHCNGTVPLSKEAAVEMCPNFDASAAEEPEAKKR